ncbi:hypothetical protein [Anabaena azotica]|uniref:Uncharacterized protein n=1 Tax=Anabaena azotica FACHB-119 TaxID=947527 RepID=A0ABR8DEL7_9NOST|nr:hypothetical protein [Anabaena azotica]MBD2505377.1 hypothetical protein [Anabaena azotica FACHB-119]
MRLPACGTVAVLREVKGSVTYIVGLKHIKSYDYLSAECQQMLSICDRLARLFPSEDLEEAARAMLKYLGELKRPYLTPMEQKLLRLIEFYILGTNE